MIDIFSYFIKGRIKKYFYFFSVCPSKKRQISTYIKPMRKVFSFLQKGAVWFMKVWGILQIRFVVLLLL